MADRHGEFVPEVPEVVPDTYVQCSRYVPCKRMDRHLGACLPSPPFGARSFSLDLIVERDYDPAAVDATVGDVVAVRATVDRRLSGVSDSALSEIDVVVAGGLVAVPLAQVGQPAPALDEPLTAA